VTTDDWPLSEGEDALLLNAAGTAFHGPRPGEVGVAVSGGSDSVALLHLITRVQAHFGGRVRAATVDHRLRREAADEARFVADLCTSLGVRHDTLVWEHGDITGNLQDQARHARYRLLGDWARAKRVGHVVIGHTADDQAETFLMGLAREAGIDGLAGMRRRWQADAVHWARPLLATPREELRAYLRRHRIGWVDDPSNADERFTRVKARRVLKSLKPLGITVEKLSNVTANLALARQAIVVATNDAADRVVTTSAGAVIIDRKEFRLLVPELRRRLLIGALRWISGAEYAPRADAAFRFEDALGRGRDATLSGCRMRITEDAARITREMRAVAGCEGPTDLVWDGRWVLEGPHSTGLTVRALGAQGLHDCPDWRATGASRDALVVTPAIWQGEHLVAAPLAGRACGWTARTDPTFATFLVSH
jgi:tRNA(Ile)-lysidine synthase